MSDIITSTHHSPETSPTGVWESVGEVATYFLVQTENMVDMTDLVSNMSRLPGVITATRVVGPYDVIANAGGDSEETRAALTGAVASLPGVTRVVTMPTASTAGGAGDTSRAA